MYLGYVGEGDVVVVGVSKSIDVFPPQELTIYNVHSNKPKKERNGQSDPIAHSVRLSGRRRSLRGGDYCTKETSGMSPFAFT